MTSSRLSRAASRVLIRSSLHFGHLISKFSACSHFPNQLQLLSHWGAAPGRTQARSLSRTRYFGALSQGNASVVWRASHPAFWGNAGRFSQNAGRRTRNLAKSHQISIAWMASPYSSEQGRSRETMLHSKVGARTRREFASPIPQASFDRIEPVVERGSVSISDCGRLRESSLH
jgi:hypothetical protein